MNHPKWKGAFSSRTSAVRTVVKRQLYRKLFVWIVHVLALTTCKKALAFEIHVWSFLGSHPTAVSSTLVLLKNSCVMETVIFLKTNLFIASMVAVLETSLMDFCTHGEQCCMSNVALGSLHMSTHTYNEYTVRLRWLAHPLDHHTWKSDAHA